MLIFFPGIGNADSRPTIFCVQGVHIQPFYEVKRGFEEACNSNIQDLIVTGMESTDVEQKILKSHPDIILAVGTEGLSKTISIKSIPIIYVMVLNPDILLKGNKNISGVNIHIPFEEQISIFMEILPGMKKIGIVYHQKKSGDIVNMIAVALKDKGIALIPKMIESSKNVPSAILELAGKVDAYWMIPDISVITPETVEFLLMTSFKNNIPIFSFAEKYVKKGALISIGMDPFDIGKQAGIMADRIFKGAKIEAVPPVDVRKALISINTKIAEKFNITIKPSLKKDAILYE